MQNPLLLSTIKTSLPYLYCGKSLRAVLHTPNPLVMWSHGQGLCMCAKHSTGNNMSMRRRKDPELGDVAEKLANKIKAGMSGSALQFNER